MDGSSFSAKKTLILNQCLFYLCFHPKNYYFSALSFKIKKSMKKIITLCLFTFAMLLGTHTMMAQSVVQVNKLASEKTMELRKFVKFDAKTQNTVYTAYQEYIQRTYTTSDMVAKGTTPSAQDIEKANGLFAEKLKSVFTAEEYDRYVSYMETKK